MSMRSPEPFDPGRRRFVTAIGATSLLTLWPGINRAATGSDTRLLLVLLRGGLDGLHLLPPIGDPAYASARGALAINDGLSLDGHFALHPQLAFAHDLYAQKQLLPLVAIAPPYRQRSHFDAQDCLENGTATPEGAKTGWLGRSVASMPGVDGLAVASVMPLSMRGAPRAQTWSPPLSQSVDSVLLQQLQVLYAADPHLAPVFAGAMGESHGDMAAGQTGGRAGGFGLPQAMQAAAKMMSASDGPRIGFVEDTGWDTHRNQAPVLANKLGELDAGLRAAHDGFGALWPRTVIVVVTEFGRTVAVNGTGGTDHGTGGAALLAGGAVRGGRVIGDWPGLSSASLNEGRDLRATTDSRALFKGVLAAHLRLADGALEARVFPGSGNVRALDGLVNG
ncbi:MAG: DUF1501 domain-containing protein [Luteimonas sp.]